MKDLAKSVLSPESPAHAGASLFRSPSSPGPSDASTSESPTMAGVVLSSPCRQRPPNRVYVSVPPHPRKRPPPTGTSSGGPHSDGAHVESSDHEVDDVPSSDHDMDNTTLSGCDMDIGPPSYRDIDNGPLSDCDIDNGPPSDHEIVEETSPIPETHGNNTPTDEIGDVREALSIWRLDERHLGFLHTAEEFFLGVPGDDGWRALLSMYLEFEGLSTAVSRQSSSFMFDSNGMPSLEEDSQPPFALRRSAGGLVVVAAISESCP